MASTRHAVALGGAAVVLSLATGSAPAARFAPRPARAGKAAKGKRRVVVERRTFTGPVVDASDWGQVEIRLEDRKTITIVGTRRSVVRHMYGLGVPVWPNHTPRSIEISDEALPTLVEEALKAQSATIDQVSGATYTSEAFTQSLQAALLQARAW